MTPGVYAARAESTGYRRAPESPPRSTRAGVTCHPFFSRHRRLFAAVLVTAR